MKDKINHKSNIFEQRILEFKDYTLSRSPELFNSTRIIVIIGDLRHIGSYLCFKKAFYFVLLLTPLCAGGLEPLIKQPNESGFQQLLGTF